MKMSKCLLGVLCVLFLCGMGLLADEATGNAAETAAVQMAAADVEGVAAAHPERPDALYWAIGICMGMGSLAAGIAVGKVGSAALGAAAEKPELLGKAIAFVGLGEGIALFGFLISLFLYLKI